VEDILGVFEEGVKEGFEEQFQFFNGETPGLLDIVVAATCYAFEAFHEALHIEIFTSEKTPKFFMWVNALKEHLLVKETFPPHDKLVAKLKSIL
jgi:glutathione S-transferase